MYLEEEERGAQQQLDAKAINVHLDFQGLETHLDARSTWEAGPQIVLNMEVLQQFTLENMDDGPFTGALHIWFQFEIL